MANPNSTNNSRSSVDVKGESLSGKEVRELFKRWKEKADQKRAAEEIKKSEESSIKSEPSVEEAKAEVAPINSTVDSVSFKGKQAEPEKKVVKSDALTGEERELLAKLLEKAGKQEVGHQGNDNGESFSIKELVEERVGAFSDASTKFVDGTYQLLKDLVPKVQKYYEDMKESYDENVAREVQDAFSNSGLVENTLPAMTEEDYNNATQELFGWISSNDGGGEGSEL